MADWERWVDKALDFTIQREKAKVAARLDRMDESQQAATRPTTPPPREGLATGWTPAQKAMAGAGAVAAVAVLALVLMPRGRKK